jgi:hypothetical protein
MRRDKSHNDDWSHELTFSVGLLFNNNNPTEKWKVFNHNLPTKAAGTVGSGWQSVDSSLLFSTHYSFSSRHKLSSFHS